MVFTFGMNGTGPQGLNHLVIARMISQPSLSKKNRRACHFYAGSFVM